MTEGLADKYRSLFVIGRGGMGAVEAAVENGADRVVALKRLLPEAARDARRSEMFLREAKVAALLDHPNVIRAFDYGENAGELYLAMEYVEGQSLSVVLRTIDSPLSPSLAAHVLAEVCEGLHAAHDLKGEAGESLHLVHRDVSPQNVMIGYDGRVRLLDFGVAKIEAESVTKTGEVKGKTAYMSPEQAMGDAVDRRSDLFGVGAVLYECLTLKRMWGQGTDMEVIRKLALEDPPALDAPPALSAIYARLVARDAKARPSTAAEVATELHALAPADGAKQLADLLERHFGDQAKAQRQKLAKALVDVDAPQKLRQSMVPPSMRRSQLSTLPAPRVRSRAWLFAVAVAAVLGVLAWAAFRRPIRAEPRVEVGPTSRPSASVTETTASPSASVARATGPVAASAVPTSAPTVSVTAPVAPPRASPVGIAPTPRPSSSAIPRPSASASAPPGIDARPF